MNIKNVESLTLDECRKILSENPDDKQLQNRYHALLEQMREHDSKEFDSCSTISDYAEFVNKYSKIKGYKSKNLDVARKLVNMQEEIDRTESDNRHWWIQQTYLKDRLEYLENRFKKANIFKYGLLLVVVLLLGMVAFLGIKYNKSSKMDKNVIHTSNSADSITKEYYDYKNTVLKSPIIVRDIKVGNVYKDSKIETEYGDTIFDANTMYLEPQIVYVGAKDDYVTLYFRIETEGYSTVSSGDSYKIAAGEHTLTLNGWGNEKQGYWKAGNYTISIWYCDKKIAEDTFIIHKSETSE
ncbi:MAG: hypothetical protein LUD00_00645 [Prevotellaceae bacterium]|nr:hypothetical protein [Prevotellaceae bacterium]